MDKKKSMLYKNLIYRYFKRALLTLTPVIYLFKDKVLASALIRFLIISFWCPLSNPLFLSSSVRCSSFLLPRHLVPISAVKITIVFFFSSINCKCLLCLICVYSPQKSMRVGSTISIFVFSEPCMIVNTL